MTEVRGAEEARRLTDALLDRIDALGTFPGRGAVPRELERLEEIECRQIIHKHYRIFYLLLGSTVRIVLIADGRRDLQALLDARLLLPDAPDPTP